MRELNTKVVLFLSLICCAFVSCKERQSANTIVTLPATAEELGLNDSVGQTGASAIVGNWEAYSIQSSDGSATLVNESNKLSLDITEDLLIFSGSKSDVLNYELEGKRIIDEQKAVYEIQLITELELHLYNEKDKSLVRFRKL